MKKILISIITIFILLFNNNKLIKAEDVKGSVSVSVNKTSVAIGSKITVTITLKCSTYVGGGIVYLDYDSNYFSAPTYSSSYFTVSQKTNGCTCLVEPSKKTSVSITFTFTTKKIGSSKIHCTTSGFIDYSGNDVIGYSENITKSIQIVEKTENNKENTQTLSQDATLSLIEVEGLKLEEEFVSDKYEYTLYAPKGTEQLPIKVTTSSSKSKVESFNNVVKEGWNDIEIICVAEDGNKKTYKIKAYVEETPTIYFDDKGVVKNLDKVERITDFIEEEYTIEQEKVILFNHGNLYLIYCLNSNNEYNYYLYSKEENKLKGKYEPIEINGRQYLVNEVLYENFTSLEEDFSSDNIILNNKTIKGWKYNAENMSDYKLLYLTDAEGNKNLYSYDTKEKTIQRYTKVIVDQRNEDLYKALAYSCAAAGVISLITSLMIVSKRKEKELQ